MAADGTPSTGVPPAATASDDSPSTDDPFAASMVDDALSCYVSLSGLIRFYEEHEEQVEINGRARAEHMRGSVIALSPSAFINVLKHSSDQAQIKWALTRCPRVLNPSDSHLLAAATRYRYDTDGIAHMFAAFARGIGGPRGRAGALASFARAVRASMPTCAWAGSLSSLWAIAAAERMPAADRRALVETAVAIGGDDWPPSCLLSNTLTVAFAGDYAYDDTGAAAAVAVGGASEARRVLAQRKLPIAGRDIRHLSARYAVPDRLTGDPDRISDCLREFRRRRTARARRNAAAVDAWRAASASAVAALGSRAADAATYAYEYAREYTLEHAAGSGTLRSRGDAGSRLAGYLSYVHSVLNP